MKRLNRIVDENADDKDLPTRPSNDMTPTEDDETRLAVTIR